MSCWSGGLTFFIIEESTGSGKTEAALTLNHRLMAGGHGHGIYFGLPTMATSNALYNRIQKVKDNFYAPGSNPPIVLAHSASHLGYTSGDNLMITVLVQQNPQLMISLYG